MFRSFFTLLVFSCSLICQAQLQSPSVIDLKQSGPVNDFAQLLTVNEEAKLVKQIDSIENATNIEYVICLIDNLNGKDIKTLAVEIGNKWGIGKANEDNGVFILLSKKPRKVFIATGIGIEAVIPDKDIQYIVDNHVIPLLKQGQYFQGFSAGVTEIQNVLNGTSAIERKDNTSIMIISAIVVAIFLGYILYDYRKLGGFDPETRKFIRNRKKTGGGLINGTGSSGSSGGNGGGSFGGGGGGGSY